MTKWIKVAQIWVLGFIVLSLSGCLATTQTNIISKQVPVKSKYTHIYSEGPFILELTRAPVGTPIQITGTPEQVARTKVKVNNGTIYVLNYWYNIIPPGAVVVQIPMGDMRTLNAILLDQTIMQAQNLRFDTVNLTTSDVVHAQVYPLHTFNLLAKDDSSVFYYGHPEVVNIRRPKCTAEVQHFKTLKG